MGIRGNIRCIYGEAEMNNSDTPRTGEPLRAYFVGNMYLSSIQQGIQAAHVLQEMHNKYCYMSNVAALKLTEWGYKHKTIILLNGGYSSDLEELYESFMRWTKNGTTIPVAKFHEEESALNGALTSVGIILPESIYAKETDNSHLDGTTYTFVHDTDWMIAKAIQSFRLAS